MYSHKFWCYINICNYITLSNSCGNRTLRLFGKSCCDHFYQYNLNSKREKDLHALCLESLCAGNASAILKETVQHYGNSFSTCIRNIHWSAAVNDELKSILWLFNTSWLEAQLSPSLKESALPTVGVGTAEFSLRRIAAFRSFCALDSLGLCVAVSDRSSLSSNGL